MGARPAGASALANTDVTGISVVWYLTLGALLPASNCVLPPVTVLRGVPDANGELSCSWSSISSPETALEEFEVKNVTRFVTPPGIAAGAAHPTSRSHNSGFACSAAVAIEKNTATAATKHPSRIVCFAIFLSPKCHRCHAMRCLLRYHENLVQVRAQ